MAKSSINTIAGACISLLVTVLAVSGSPAKTSPNQVPDPDGIIFIGKTQTKEIYITRPNITGTFTSSLAMGCPLRFQMSLISVESAEEVELIDSYFASTEGNSSNPAWTSGVDRVGRIPAYWASSGEQVGTFPAAIVGPWPSGAGSSPTYAHYNCISIRRTCVRPPGAPPGCFPATTMFNYNICSSVMRYICQRTISQ